jgi:hypothetical protein
MSTPLAVSCPNCGAGLKLKSKTFVGKKVPCPKCKQPFVVEEPPEDEFLEDDFGGGDDYQEEEDEEEEELPRSKKASKGGKGKKKSKGGGGGSGIVLMIGGAILGVGLLVGVVYGAMSLLSGMGGSSEWTAWMPEDTDVVVRVKPSELANSQFLKPVMDHPTLSKLANMPPAQAGGGNELVTALNLSVKDIDTITMGGKDFAVYEPAGNRQSNFIFVVRTKVAVDTAKLDQAASVITKETYNDKTVYAVNNSNPKMLLHAAAPDTFVFGSDAVVRAAIDRKGAGAGSRFKLTDSSAQLFVCAAPKDPSVFNKGNAAGSPFASPFGGGTKEAQMNSMSFAISFNSDANMTMVMNSADSLNSQRQTDEFKKALDMLKAQLDASGGMLDPTAGLKAHVKTMLDGATISVSGKTATVKMTLPGKIVSDGLVLAAPFMPMLEQMVAEQQKKAANSSSGSSASPVGITDYPGAVINAGNNAQNRINNLGDQHNANLSAQMQEGAGAAHGASNGTPDPAEMMRRQQAGGGAPAGGAPNPGAMMGPPGGANAASAHGGGNAAPDPAEMMRRQQAGGGGAPGGAPNAAHGDGNGTPDPAEMMRRQQAGGGAPIGPPNGAAGEGHGAPDPAEMMRRQQAGGGGAPGAGGAPDPAEMMRRQQAGGAPGAGGAPDPAEMMRRQQGGGAGQPAAEGQNGNEPKPAPRSRSRRRTS